MLTPNRFIFFFNDTATTEIYTLSLHDALPISSACRRREVRGPRNTRPHRRVRRTSVRISSTSHRLAQRARSEEHTSELQSRLHLVCRLLLEKKKNNHASITHAHRTYLPTFVLL